MISILQKKLQTTVRENKRGKHFPSTYIIKMKRQPPVVSFILVFPRYCEYNKGNWSIDYKVAVLG